MTITMAVAGAPVPYLDGAAVTERYTVAVDGAASLGPFEAATPARSDVAPMTATGRVFRFDVQTSSGGNVGAIEGRIFGPR
ncbi:MAG: hypothetical protein ACKVWR_07155 [Acidimicrobiales bacterium]